MTSLQYLFFLLCLTTCRMGPCGRAQRLHDLALFGSRKQVSSSCLDKEHNLYRVLTYRLAYAALLVYALWNLEIGT